jgi:anti-sigma factor RsiW
MTCDDLERDLDPYVDRELGPDSDAVLRQHLRGCVACRRRVADREAIGPLVRSMPYHAAPDRLRMKVLTQVRRARWRRSALAWVTAAAVVVVSLSGGIALVRSSRTVGESGAVADAVVDGHVRSLMADHLVDVASTDQHTVKPWFLGKLDFSPPVRDLASLGFPLVGGRLEYLSGRPVAALVYQRQKHTINVFIWPGHVDTAAAASRFVRGFHVHEWARDGMTFWVVSDLNDGELTRFVRALQES